jgi:hypothetical protein
MIIISHRGYWKNNSEKNTIESFERTFKMGFGTETDLRDQGSQIVISHDIPTPGVLTAEAFFDVYKQHSRSLPLALNIKADGLQVELVRLLAVYEITNYFVFDMAVPDGLLYARRNMRTYTRQSEYENVPPFYELADGVWLDEFNGHWITDEVIEQHQSNGKSICIVSPELHRRDNSSEWSHYRQIEARLGTNKLMLCTDFPEQAQGYFNE